MDLNRNVFKKIIGQWYTKKDFLKKLFENAAQK